MGHRQTETELRLATEVIAVAAAVREVGDELREDRSLRARVDDHERRISALEKGRSEAAIEAKCASQANASGTRDAAIQGATL